MFPTMSMTASQCYPREERYDNERASCDRYDSMNGESHGQFWSAHNRHASIDTVLIHDHANRELLFHA